MNNVFPEDLNELPDDPKLAVKKMEEYIRYMCERIDFAITAGGKTDIAKLNKEVAELGTAVQTLNTDLDNKVDKETGKGLSTEDYTSAEKTKLSGIETGANKTVVDSALSSTSNNPLANKVINSNLSQIKRFVNSLIYNDNTTAYTATQDCWISTNNPNSPVYIDSVAVTNGGIPYQGFLKNGQILSFESTSAVKAFSLKS